MVILHAVLCNKLQGTIAANGRVKEQQNGQFKQQGRGQRLDH